MNDIERETAAFLRRIKREKIVAPGPGQWVDECNYSKTGWAVWDRDDKGRWCTCKPAKAPQAAP